jgi:hypothetical protein
MNTDLLGDRIGLLNPNSAMLAARPEGDPPMMEFRTISSATGEAIPQGLRRGANEIAGVREDPGCPHDGQLPTDNDV